MKIDRVLIACCKTDFYLTRICVASIRYWNKSIRIDLLKDLSAGDFDTQELELHFSVGLLPLPFSKMNAYSKLYPFVMETHERVMVLDSDIVWLGDMIPYLEQFSADMLVHTYSPVNVKAEMDSWYFRYDPKNSLFAQYQYPGFLFNSGQMVLNTGIFPLAEVKELVHWEENTRARQPDVFVCADQDIVNYIFAKWLQKKEISFAHVHLFEWGWTYDQTLYPLKDVLNKKEHKLMLHWYGVKKGLLFSLPQNDLLYFFEAYYFSIVPQGKIKMQLTRLQRTAKHMDVLAYEIAKKSYKKLIQIK